tara:strand:+ start:294 stop:500 length:207 start_codon:yes stop_codon:yes gene_type:complete
MIYKGPGISTYWGSEKYEKRRAEVMKDENGFYVDMYFDGELVESRPLYDHSERYAEDCAENYVMGIIQ